MFIGFNDFDLSSTNEGTNGVEDNRIAPNDLLAKSVIDGRITQWHTRKVADYMPIGKHDAESMIGFWGDSKMTGNMPIHQLCTLFQGV